MHIGFMMLHENIGEWSGKCRIKWGVAILLLSLGHPYLLEGEARRGEGGGAHRGRCGSHIAGNGCSDQGVHSQAWCKSYGVALGVAR
jgi:hypothetical protein